MSSKSFSSLIVLSFLLLSSVSSLPGDWEPIPDVNAPEVQAAAKFAVTEHNNETKSKLVYKSVESGDQQVVSGWNYRLVIVAGDGGTDGKYEAGVSVQASGTIKLLYFKNFGEQH